MKFSTGLLTVTLLVVPATAVLATPAAAAATAVARYSFNGGLVAGRTIAENTGRGVPLKLRSAAGGALRFVAHGAGRALAFPPRCAAGATTACPRVLLEGGDDPDLDPGARSFRFGVSVRATRAQVGTGANLMQKGVATAGSQWKLRLGGNGRAQCGVVGRGSSRIYLARSDIAIANGVWHQVTCQKSATGLYVFVDGKVRGSVALPRNLVIDNGLPLRVGARNLNDLGHRYGGLIDDVYFTRD